MATRDDLRDHLLAVLEAAPELPRDGREHLADVFLSELDSQFRIVPRSQWRRRDDLAVTFGNLLRSLTPFWPVAALAFGLLVLLPLLAVPMFILFHFPFLFILIFFVFWRLGGPGPWRRRRITW